MTFVLICDDERLEQSEDKALIIEMAELVVLCNLGARVAVLEETVHEGIVDGKRYGIVKSRKVWPDAAPSE